jgi:nucleoid-associated protein YgaU
MSTTRSTTRGTAHGTARAATTIRPAPTVRDRVTGLLATLGIGAIVAGVPLLLLAVQRALWPTDLSWDTAPVVLASPDGTGLIVLAFVAGWVLWVWLTITVLAQVTTSVRNLRLPRVPGLPQGWAGRLVAAASLLFATVPTAQALAPAVTVAAVAPLEPDATTTRQGLPRDSSAGSERRMDPAARAGSTTGTSPETRPYTVQHNDTLWGLARDHLGDGTRWREIFKLNKKIIGAKPDFLATGAVLRLPVDNGAESASSEKPSATRQAEFAQNDHAVTHVVEPGESLWEIASARLGDPARYPEIVRASSSTVQPGGSRLDDPDHIEPGWTLTIPPTTASATTGATPGPDSAARSTNGRGQPNQRSTDGGMGSDTGDDTSNDTSNKGPASSDATPATEPSATQSAPTQAPASSSPSISPAGPGAVSPWTLPTSPTPEPSATSSDRASADSSPLGSAADQGSAQATTDPRLEATTPDAQEDVEPNADQAPEPSTALAPGLTGAGVVLAALLYLALRRKRALQRRDRRPGRAIRPDQAAPVPLEHTLRVTGAQVLPDVERLDRLLWATLGITETSTAPRPPLVAVELDHTTAVLHLTEPVDLPEPWESSTAGPALRWSAPLAAADQFPEERLDAFRPYPFLAAIGQDGDGRTWLLDLERTRGLVVTGQDPTAVEDFGRALTAELAINPWSENLTPHLIGFHHAPTGLGLFTHIEPHDPSANTEDQARPGSTDWLADITQTVQDTFDVEGDDREWYFAVITTAGGHQYPGVEDLASAVRRHPGRPGAVVVALGGQPEPGDVVADLHDGRVRAVVDGLELDLVAVGLSEAELDAAAALVDLGGDDALEDVPVPVPVDEEGRPAPTDAIGAPRADTTQPRPEDPEQPAGPASVLPASSAYYETTGVTTGEELDRIAPVTPPEAADNLLAHDPDLDTDVAEWFAPHLDRPRLQLLGPVSLRSGQMPEDAIRHKARLIEYATYLWLHPNGVTGEAMAQDMNVPVDRVRKDILDLRKWLGISSRTGELHIPTARKGQAFEQTGSKGYQVHDILVDTDLFLRLRARAHARGADGISDLLTALRLVHGHPFDLLRRDGWAWLTGGERPDLMIEHAIVDAAHLVFLRSMADGDHDQARAACATGIKAVPEDETIRLDLVQVDWAEGHLGRAERRLNEDVFDRTDHGLSGLDLAGRTREVLASKRNQWDSRRHPGSSGGGRREDSTA